MQAKTCSAQLGLGNELTCGQKVVSLEIVALSGKPSGSNQCTWPIAKQLPG